MFIAKRMIQIAAIVIVSVLLLEVFVFGLSDGVRALMLFLLRAGLGVSLGVAGFAWWRRRAPRKPALQKPAPPVHHPLSREAAAAD